MKKFSTINESESNEPIKMTIEIEMSPETAKNLEGYYDCNSPESAILEHMSGLHELDGVDIKFNIVK